MAIIKSVKRVGKTPQALKRLIQYVGEKAALLSGINCSDNYLTIAEEFTITKKFYGKETGRQYKHIVQSFSENEVSPEKAHEIGLEFCKSFQGFEVFMVTHTDKEHIHNHIILNSVSLETGLKYHESKADLEKLKEFSDSICLNNNLTVIDKKNKSENIATYDLNSYKIMEEVKKGNKESDLVNLALKIKDTASVSRNQEEFISKFRGDGFEVEWTLEKKHITFTIPNKELIGKKNKFRLEKINKYFNKDIFTKEGLENEFGRVREITKDKTLFNNPRRFNVYQGESNRTRKTMSNTKKLSQGIER